MRIIAGELRRRKIETPKDSATTRPMPDHVREAVFNLLRGHAEGQTVIDLFAGTGAVGLEAVSRGASRCVFIERDKKMVGVIERNVQNLGVQDRCEIVRSDALGPLALARCPTQAHLIFFDPPYPMVRDAKTWQRCQAQLAKLIERLDDAGYLVLRTPRPAVRRVDDGARNVADEHPAEARKSSRRSSTKGGRSRPREIDDDGDAVEELDASDWSLENWTDAEDLSQDGVRYEPVDLSITGAIGPETHDYGKMSMHLYMRKR